MESNSKSLLAFPLLKSRTTRRNEFGFTLPELLVAVAIISILAALTFVAVRSGIEKSRRAACSGNLRQIGAILAIYKSDGGKMPLGVPSKGWPIGRFNTPQMGFRALDEAGLIEDGRILFCPSGTLKADPYWSAWGPNDKYSGYCYWYDYAYDNPSVVDFENLARKEQDIDMSTIIASDIMGKDPTNTGLLNHSDKSGNCAGGNVLYGDGRVTWFNMNECKSATKKGFDFWLPKK
jgi:prepilin-type N-terminal cleavage/methylation domain-containing protein